MDHLTKCQSPSGISRGDMDNPTTEVQREERARDERGKFLPKRPLEFTWPHFWLEVVEVTVAIVLGSAIYDGILWLIKGN